MIKIFNSLFVTLFGIGKVKAAPGTIASFLTTSALFYFFHVIKLSHFVILLFLLILFIYSFYAITSYIKEREDKDPQEIVVDEVIGQSIPIYLYEISHNSQINSESAYLVYFYIFILFRFFDIKKPFPVSYIDKKFKNSFGVIFDDVIAGFYVVLTLIIFMVLKSRILT